ncbi:MAG: threonine synthase [Acidobacteriota bacterium]
MTLSTLTHLECAATGERHAADEVQTVSRVGRPLLARYDLERAARTLGRGALAARPWSMWRYAEVLPVADPAAVVSLGEGATPLVEAPRLARRFGLRRLSVKDEGHNPTGTFKARGLSAAISKAVELEVAGVALPTAGNAGAAAAAFAARAGLPCLVAMPRDAPPAAMAEVLAYGARLELVDGLIHDAGRFVAEHCRTSGWLDLSTTKEPYRVEGKKTMGYELWERFADGSDAIEGALPDAILYPTGGGTGLIGMWKAFAELRKMGLATGAAPRMIAVQASGCAPIVRAVEAGAARAEPWRDAATLAPGIRVPRPFADDLVLAAVRESGGTAIAVEDAEIVAALRELAVVEGLDAAPEGAATVAALPKLLARGDLRATDRVVIFDCGTGLKHPELRPPLPS